MRNFAILILLFLLVFTSDLKPCKALKNNIVYTVKYDFCLNDYKGRQQLQNQCITDLKEQYNKKGE